MIDPALAGPALPGQPVQRHPPGAEPRGARRLGRQPTATRAPPGSCKDWLRAGRPPRGRPSRALRLRADLRGRGHDAHPQGLPGPGPARAVRPGEDLSRTSRPWPARRPTAWPSTRRPGSTSARSSGSIPTRTTRCCAPSRPACATGRRWRRPTTSASMNRLWVVTDQADAHGRPGPDGRQADLHRRRPPPLRDRPEVPRRPRRGRRSSAGPTTRRTSA